MSIKTVELVRTYTRFITLSHFMIDDLFICHAFELPWRNNQKRISCIPEGTYRFEIMDRHERLGLCYICVSEVPNRSEIFIHAGNLTTDIKGCIAPVLTLRADVGGDLSRNAILKLREKCGDEFMLKITVQGSKGVL